MKTLFIGLAVIAAGLFAATNGYAQTGGKETLQGPPARITVDGDIKEWGDSLRYFNTEKNINYAIANNRDTLYMAIRITDPVEKKKVLKAGITFSVDTRGKKKDSYSLTYPVNTGSVPASNITGNDNADITRQDRDDLERERLTTLRGIKAEGFKDIEGDMITTSNTYGIQAAINYDEAGNLNCEMAVPISFFHAEDPSKNEWAFNFKINGLTRPAGKIEGDQGGAGGHSGRGGGGGFGGGGGRGGHGGRGGGGQPRASGDSSQGEMFKSRDFWVKYYLSK